MGRKDVVNLYVFLCCRNMFWQIDNKNVSSPNYEQQKYVKDIMCFIKVFSVSKSAKSHPWLMKRNPQNKALNRNFISFTGRTFTDLWPDTWFLNYSSVIEMPSVWLDKCHLRGKILLRASGPYQEIHRLLHTTHIPRSENEFLFTQPTKSVYNLIQENEISVTNNFEKHSFATSWFPSLKFSCGTDADE